MDDKELSCSSIFRMEFKQFDGVFFILLGLYHGLIRQKMQEESLLVVIHECIYAWHTVACFSRNSMDASRHERQVKNRKYLPKWDVSTKKMGGSLEEKNLHKESQWG